MHLDGILALVLQHYHNCIEEKVLLAYSSSPVIFSFISSPPLPEKCLALNGNQGLGLIQLLLPHFNSFT